MNNIEHIVADFETCKRAAEMGFKIKTIFHWFKRDDDGEISFTIETKRTDKFPSTAPAPTVEEVPLPTVHMQAKTRMTISYVSFNGLGVFWEYQSNQHLELYINNPNEATTRLKMAIWLIENVPEARQWYIDNGYLEEVNNDRD